MASPGQAIPQLDVIGDFTVVMSKLASTYRVRTTKRLPTDAHLSLESRTPARGADVFGWFQVPIVKQCPTNGRDHAVEVTTAAIAAAEASLDLADYDLLVVVGELHPCAGGGGALGSFPVGAGAASLPAAFVSSPNDWTEYDDWLAIHEVTHLFGISHSRFLHCPAYDPSDPGCVKEEYGDIYTAIATIIPYGGHFNARHKEMAGWLADGELLTAPSAGTYRLLPLSSQATGLKALKIPSAFNDWVYVEFRQPAGFDAFDPAALGPSNVFDGALLHAKDTFPGFPEVESTSTLLIDPTPPPAHLAAEPRAKSAALEVGETFTIGDRSGGGSSITVVEIDDGELVVELPEPANPPAVLAGLLMLRGLSRHRRR